jgi:YidC/Oxa1 family membrane protein insertase
MRETEEIHVTKSFGMSYLFSEVIFNNTYNVERETIEKQTWFNRNQGKALWFGLRRKYIAAVINFDGESEASLGAEPIKEKRNEKDPGTYALTVSDNMLADSIALDFTILPLQWQEIKAMDQGYEKIIVSGWEWMGADKWFVWLCGLLLKILNVFYALIPNYGIAIILLTIFVKIITTPLSLKQLRSTRSMMALKPELDAIRAKNRGDMRAQQQDMMALYARHGISPFSGLAGCFPMLLQMPIFIGLFVVLGRAIELREAPFAGWITDLSKTDIIWSGLSIPYIMPEGVGILPFLMVLSTWYQMKQTITDPNQKMIVWMMPAMMFVFSSVMPSGLVLYWIISNLWGIAQYMVINRKPALAGNAPKGKVVEAKVVKK